jgi:hypothetical protein
MLSVRNQETIRTITPLIHYFNTDITHQQSLGQEESLVDERNDNDLYHSARVAFR